MAHSTHTDTAPSLSCFPLFTEIHPVSLTALEFLEVRQVRHYYLNHIFYRPKPSSGLIVGA